MIKPILTTSLLAVFMIFSHLEGTAQQFFNHRFNPMEGMVDQSEKPLRDEICLNGLWQFMPVYSNDIKQFELPTQFTWEDTELKIPSPWNVNNFSKGDGGDFNCYPSYPQKWENAQMGWMKKTFDLHESWQNKQIVLHFEAIAGDAKIYVNGKLAGENLDIYFPTSVDVTDLLKQGSNEIIVGVAKASLTDDQGKYGRRNYVAGSFWGQHIAGIWQDVYLLATPQLVIDDCFVQPKVDQDKLTVEITITNHSDKEIIFSPKIVIHDRSNKKHYDIFTLPQEENHWANQVIIFDTIQSVRILPYTTITLPYSQIVYGRLDLWTPETPNLYGLELSLSHHEQLIDKKMVRFGWRQFSIDGKELLLNGKPIQLKGDSWHFMGIPQMTRRYAWAWFKMLKDANANAVRLHAMPFPEFYLDMADEMGICVLDETGIWSSDGGPKMDSDAYWAYCQEHVKSLVLRDRNHPSVFGWSVCNETLPVAIHVFHAPEEIVQRQVDEINNWVSIVQKYDPTRDWISGDGETMRPTNLTTIVGHYGGTGGMKEWSSKNQPWGIGEQGMAYYGTPKQVASVNGNRAYESQMGRMEGLAIEAHNLISQQRQLKASYSSVFNIVWYGLQPLELGLNDVSKASTETDGIFFGEFKEGQPGVQPERLGPYSTTLNPGYDNTLPLYKPWPLFEAIKAANSEPIQPYQIEKSEQPNMFVESDFIAKELLLVASENSTLKETLLKIGVQFSSGSKSSSSTLIIVDGKNPESSSKSKKLVAKTLAKGGKIMVLGISSESVSEVNELLGTSLETTERSASSFVKKGNNTVVNNLNNKDFYFTEIIKSPTLKFAFKGDEIQKGSLLIEACNTDWLRWNYKSETLKTGAVVRSERETKATGKAMVSINKNKGEIILNAIELTDMGETGLNLIKVMLANLNVSFANASINNTAINAEGMITNALFCGTFQSDKPDLATLTGTDFIDEKNCQAQNGKVLNGKLWKPIKANPETLFNFKDEVPNEENEQAAAYLSLWIFSPRSLVNLLVEPDMPKVDLVCGADDGFVLFMNGKKIYTDDQPGGYNPEEYIIEKIPFEKGWNHLLIKTTQSGGDWKFSGQFRCDQSDFLKKMKSKIE